MANWVTVQPGIPTGLTSFLDALNSFINALLAILNIALTILEIIKAFLIGLLNPLLLIIEAIINEIEAILNDLRQLGLYIAGDIRLKYPYNDLLGGFQAYERRMIRRLVDRTDPTRPSFSNRSGVLAIFLYVGVDISLIQLLIRAIVAILRFFGQRPRVKSFPQPVGLVVSYGLEGATLASFGTITEQLAAGDTPNSANIRWELAAPPGGGKIAWPQPVPFGFLVEVSTLKDGLLLSYETVAQGAAPDEKGIQSRKFGLMQDATGAPARLFGGVDQMDIGDLAPWKGALKFDGSLQVGTSRLYAFRNSADNVPIPIEKLQPQGEKYPLQRTFFVNSLSNILSVGPGQPFAITLPHDEMPWDADFELKDGDVKVTLTGDTNATTVFVRVVPVTKNVKGPSDWKYVTSAGLIAASVGEGRDPTFQTPSDISFEDRGDPSEPLTVVFPGVRTRTYLDSVTTAILILLLSRSDLGFFDPLTEVEADVAAAQAALDTAQEDFEQGEGDLGIVIAAQQALDAVVADLNVAKTQFKSGVARTPTGLEDLARFLIPELIGSNNISKFFSRREVEPTEARRDILRRARAMTNRLYAMTGPMPASVEEYALNATAITTNSGLRSLDQLRWSDLDPGLNNVILNAAGANATIIESLDPREKSACEAGVGLNPVSIGLDAFSVVKLMKAGRFTLRRAPGFLESLDQANFTSNYGYGGDVFFQTFGSEDNSPVVFDANRGTTITASFARNLLYNLSDVYPAAALILNLAAAPLTLSKDPENGAWIAVRFLPQGFPALEAALDLIINWMRSILAGVSTIIDLIIAYITFVQTRILEIEAILRRIQNLLNFLITFSLPETSGLVVTALGTDGILQELVQATDKPSDPSTNYGGGLVILAGGVPALILEILAAFFPPASE